MIKMVGFGKRTKKKRLGKSLVEVAKLKVTHTPQQRMAMPEGKGTGRSMGSNKRLSDLGR